jgi:hypothetical protein
MKSLKSICTGAILTLVLTASVAAGELSSPGYVPPPPPEEDKIIAVVDTGTPTEIPSDENSLSSSNVANLLWLFVSFF